MVEIKVVKKVLAESEKVAAEIRALLDERRIYAFNLIGAPGSGKTALLEATLRTAKETLRPGIIEGDIATTADAERLAAFGVPVVQINTGPFGGECHLGANFIRAALNDLPLDGMRTLFIENVGNLVCPAEFDVGEDEKVAVLSVAEGEDKPLKYPLLFREAQAVVVTKTDLLPALEYDISRLRTNLLAVNTRLAVFEVSARTGTGVAEWVDYILSKLNLKSAQPK